MGHFYSEVIAVGRDRKEAERNAIDDFLSENGRRYSVRDVTEPRLLRRVPPKVMQATEEDGVRVFRQVEDAGAPTDRWQEEWSFVLHTHA